jgi:hypothetical protein
MVIDVKLKLSLLPLAPSSESSVNALLLLLLNLACSDYNRIKMILNT